MNSRTVICVLFSTAALALATTGQADPIIRLSDGSTTVEVGSTVSAFSSRAAANTGYTGNVGSNWSLNLSNTPGSMQYSLDASNIGAGGTYLDVAISDTGFSLMDIDSLAQFVGSISGSTSGLVTWWMFIDDSDQLFGQATQIGQGTNTSSDFASAFDDLRAVDGTYSMTLLVRINHGNAARTTNINFQGFAQLVPEPGTVLLLALGLLGLGLARSRA